MYHDWPLLVGTPRQILWANIWRIRFDAMMNDREIPEEILNRTEASFWMENGTKNPEQIYDASLIYSPESDQFYYCKKSTVSYDDERELERAIKNLEDGGAGVLQYIFNFISIIYIRMLDERDRRIRYAYRDYLQKLKLKIYKMIHSEYERPLTDSQKFGRITSNFRGE